MKTKALSLAIMLFLVGCGSSSTQSSDDKSPVSKDPIVKEKTRFQENVRLRQRSLVNLVLIKTNGQRVITLAMKLFL